MRAMLCAVQRMLLFTVLWCDNVRALYGARAVCYTLW
jgi:hypothetical protein